MKLLELNKLFLVFTLLSLFACVKKDNLEIIPCKEGEIVDVPIRINLNTRRSSATCFIDDPAITGDKEFYYIINSNVEYEKYIKCPSNMPFTTIDFTKETLLCGRFYSYVCGIVVEQKVSKECEKENYEYFVSIYKGTCAAVVEIFYFVVIPKTSDQANVKFKVVERRL